MRHYQQLLALCFQHKRNHHSSNAWTEQTTLEGYRMQVGLELTTAPPLTHSGRVGG